MSLEKQKREIEYEIERETDPAKLKILQSALKKVLRLIEEMQVRGHWLISQSAQKPSEKFLNPEIALSILAILATKSYRAAYALINANLSELELWALISSIAQEETQRGQAPLGAAIGAVLKPKLSDWKMKNDAKTEPKMLTEACKPLKLRL